MAQAFKVDAGKELVGRVGSSGGFARKYDWDSWFAGDLLLIERSSGGENDKGTITSIKTKRDYEVPNDGMPPKIKTAARHRYMVCDIYRTNPNTGARLKDSLLIQGRKMTAEERVAEDALRAEEKAADKLGLKLGEYRLAKAAGTLPTAKAPAPAPTAPTTPTAPAPTAPTHKKNK